MITANVFQRTFFIKFGDSTGTAFAIDHDKKQYLVTARHVCEGIKDSDNICVYHEHQWKNASTKIVGLGASDDLATDVAVLALDFQIAPSHPLPASSGGLVWGQDVYFLGFPYGLHTIVDLNNGYPLPLVKGAVMSGSLGHGTGKPETFLLDGHNNPGFSGGPVVFREANKPEFRVMAIVSAYRTEETKIKFQGKETGLTSSTNTGLVVCPSIKQVVDMIVAKPIGAVVEG